MGTGEASHWAELFFGSFGIGMLEGRPKIRRETTRCRQLCDDYIPWTSFKGNYPIGQDCGTKKDKVNKM